MRRRREKKRERCMASVAGLSYDVELVAGLRDGRTIYENAITSDRFRSGYWHTALEHGQPLVVRTTAITALWLETR